MSSGIRHTWISSAISNIIVTVYSYRLTVKRTDISIPSNTRPDN